MTLFTADNLNRGIFPKCHSLTIVREWHKIKSIWWRFNRVVTQRIGALDDAYLSRGRSPGLSCLLWEIKPAGSEVRLLRARLGLDSAITLPMTEDTARIPRICPSAALPGTGFSAGGVVSGCHRRGRENKLLGNSFLSQRPARPCLRRSGQKTRGAGNRRQIAAAFHATI
jgi:hypothetical protein